MSIAHHLKKISFSIGLATLVSLALNLACTIPQIKADRLESDSFVIQFGNFNMGSGKRTGTNYNLTYTMGQIAPGPYGDYDTSDYFLGSGFQYIYQIPTFSFSISELQIDFGSMSPGSFYTGSNTLTINTRGAGGYTIYAYESDQLAHTNGTDQIPDTTCDDSDCDETQAAKWSSTDAYGFGFNAQGDTVATDFTAAGNADCTANDECFRQFADINSESMQSIMSSTQIADNDQATITYQTAISGLQAAGNYYTSVVYIAVPGY